VSEYEWIGFLLSRFEQRREPQKIKGFRINLPIFSDGI